MIDRSEIDTTDHVDGLDYTDTEDHTHLTDQYQDITAIKYYSCLKQQVGELSVHWSFQEKEFSFGWNSPFTYKVN